MRRFVLTWLRASVAYRVVALSLFCLAGCVSRASAPVAKHGVLDARGWDFARDGSLSLDGEWEFFWHEDLLPGQFASAHEAPLFVKLAPWNRYEKDGQHLPRSGYGTYRLRVLLPKDARVLAFNHGVTMTASAFYLDGALVAEHGQVARDADHIVPRIRPAIVEFAPNGEQLEIVVRVANFSFLVGGLADARLGRPQDLYGERDLRLASTLFLLGAILMMGLYHGGLFVLRPKERAPIYFMGLCLSLCTFSLFSGDMFILRMWPSLPGELWWKSYLWAWYAGTIYFNAFLSAIFPDEYPRRWLKPQLWFVLGMALIVLVTTMRIHLWVSILFHIYTLGTGVLALTLIGKALRRQRPGARLMLWACIVLFVTVINDIVVALRIVSFTLYLAPLGLFIFILLQSVLLAARFSKAFDMVEASERARTQFFHNTSHELRTPLNGILGFIDLLRRGHYGPLENGARAALDKMSRLSEGLKSQVNTILDLAKSKQGKLSLECSRTSLDELVEEATALADGLCLSGGAQELRFVRELSWDPEHEHPTFVTDHDKLRTVLRNLLGNAFKFRELKKSHTVTLRIALSAHALHIEVEDTGIGIPKTEQQRVFEDFVQLEGSARRNYEGTGLGLALVKSCVNLLGGQIALDSEPGRGTRVTLDLPEHKLDTLTTLASEGERPRELREPSGATRIVTSVRTDAPEVMVVDDNVVNLEVVSELLRGAGYRVVTCTGGAEALESLHASRPALLLLDVMMPEVSGEDVLNAVRGDAELRDLPVILLTARAAREDRLTGLRLGADDYLSKPIDSGELLLRVRNTLERANLSRDKAERDQHLEAARAVQAALLPIEREFPGVALEDHYHAADKVGGDWFGYGFDPRARRLYVALGDVTGHGLPAALVTGAASGAFRAALTLLFSEPQSCEVAAVRLTEALNQAVRHSGARAQRLMSMAIVCLDLARGQGFHVNAGHGPVYIFGGSEARVLHAAGAPLGGDVDAQRPITGFTLAPGEALFLHSDGLTENEGPDQRTLSARKLQRILRQDGDLSTLKQLVLREGHAIWREQPLEDDVCFVLVRWNGEAGSRVRPPTVRGVG